MSITDIIIGTIHIGEDNAVSLAELCRRTNESEKSVRLCIEDLRRKGAVICSSSKGILFAKQYRRAEAVCPNRARSQSIKKTLSAAERLLRNWENGGDENG